MLENKRLLIAIALLAVIITSLIAAGSWASFNDQEQSSDNTLRIVTNWDDLAWHYRKPLIINNGGGALSNFQMKVTINTVELVSAGKMQADGDDIRFTTSDGTTNMNYWIESGINTASTNIWLKVPSIPGGDSIIYMYYGNTATTAMSDGEDTFIFFDSFETDLSKWNISGSATRSSSQHTNGSYSMRLSGSVTAYASFTSQTNAVVEWDARPDQINTQWYQYIYNSSQYRKGPMLLFDTDETIEYQDSYQQRDFSPTVPFAADTWYSFKLSNINVSADNYDIYVNGSLKKSNAGFYQTLTGFNRIYFNRSSSYHYFYVDLVKVRAYAATEPALSNVGDEE